MARSLRSRKVKASNTGKRKTFFGDVARAREERIASRLHGSIDATNASSANANESATSGPDSERSLLPENPPIKSGENSMAVDEPKRVSTSGWKNKKRLKRKLNSLKKSKRH